MSPNVVKWVFERHVLAATMQPRCQSTNHITLRTPPGYLNTHDGEAKAARLQVVWVSWWSGVDAAMSHLLHRHRHARDLRRLDIAPIPAGVERVGAKRRHIRCPHRGAKSWLARYGPEPRVAASCSATPACPPANYSNRTHKVGEISTTTTHILQKRDETSRFRLDECVSS
ncbi:hypothetical protein JG687_00006424 [Phytophthora cactorum]|uniref:Uncharacterized protein n=1 Tax=Phytophthora cactorum TaxID=29920 RepID=A0A8T1UI02_9STRA|nr:hypothetical protein JG687_00006424 [Phytophthora cactorum]